MAAGEHLKKWTWLLDEVTIRGRVRQSDSTNTSTDIGGADNFTLELDANYQHMVDLMRGNNPLPGSNVPHGIKVEAYSRVSTIADDTHPGFDEDSAINRTVPRFPLDDKPGNFTVQPAGAPPRDLLVGDHIEITGRWVIENQHEDDCLDWVRGGLFFIQVGCVWCELHPFHWDRIKLLDNAEGTRDLPLTGHETEMLSLAVPLYEQTHRRNWLAGFNQGRVYLAPDGSNYHTKMSAHMHIACPALAQPYRGNPAIVRWDEEVILNGTGRPLAEVRQVTVTDDGIQVNATVDTPGDHSSIHDPANNQSVYQSRFQTFWAPRLTVAPPEDAVLEGGDPPVIARNPLVQGCPQQVYLTLVNAGPDELTVTAVETDPAGILDYCQAANLPPEAYGFVQGMCTPPERVPPGAVTTPEGHTYTVDVGVTINTTDPVYPTVRLVDRVTASIGNLCSVTVTPNVIDFGAASVFGQPVRRTVTVTNNGAVRRADIYEVRIIDHETPAPPSPFHLPPRFTVDTKMEGAAVGPGESLDISVWFAPHRVENASATLSVKVRPPILTMPTGFLTTLLGRGEKVLLP